VAVEVLVPKMSDHMESGEIIGWLVQEGDWVEEGQPILEIVTDKAAVELEAPASGLLKAVRTGAVSAARVPIGETIAFVAQPDEVVDLLTILESVKDMAVPEVCIWQGEML